MPHVAFVDPSHGNRSADEAERQAYKNVQIEDILFACFC